MPSEFRARLLSSSLVRTLVTFSAQLAYVLGFTGVIGAPLSIEGPSGIFLHSSSYAVRNGDRHLHASSPSLRPLPLRAVRALACSCFAHESQRVVHLKGTSSGRNWRARLCMSGTFEEEAAPTVEHGTSRQCRPTRLDPNGDSLCIDVDIEQKRV